MASTSRGCPGGLLAACLLGLAGAAPAQAAVKDCDWNMVRAKPLGTYLNVTSVRDLSCKAAKRRVRSARVSFSPPRMRLAGWSCVHSGTSGAGTQDPTPQFRCTRRGQAFRATALP